MGGASSPAEILLLLSFVGVTAVGESFDNLLPVSLSDAAFSLREADSAERPQSLRRLTFESS